MSDIVERLNDLHKQATTERSHYYVAACCKDAITEIERLRKALSDLVSAPDGELYTQAERRERALAKNHALVVLAINS